MPAECPEPRECIEDRSDLITWQIEQSKPSREARIENQDAMRSGRRVGVAGRTVVAAALGDSHVQTATSAVADQTRTRRPGVQTTYMQRLYTLLDRLDRRPPRPHSYLICLSNVVSHLDAHLPPDPALTSYMYA